MPKAVEPEITAAIAAGNVPSEITAAYLMENRDPPCVAAIYFMGALTTVVVMIRCYGRLFLVKKFGLDDWLALASLPLYIAFIALSIRLLDLGSGRHMEYIIYVMDKKQVEHTEVLDFIGHLIYAFQLYICRLSGLAFYRRLSARHRNLLRGITASWVFITLATIPQVLLIVFHCIPVTAAWPYSWSEELSKYKCLAWGVVYATNSAISLSCDFVIFTIPAAIIRALKADKKRKIQLTCILFPGVIVIIVSCVRLYLVVRGGWDFDGSWFYSPQLAVQNAEVGGTLIALSVPGLKPLLGTIFEKISTAEITWGKSTSSKTNDTSEALKNRPGEVGCNRSTAGVWANRTDGSNVSESCLLENGNPTGIMRTTNFSVSRGSEVELREMKERVL